MKLPHFLWWSVLLITLDQIVKIIIYSRYMDVSFGIVPSLLEFKPVFNDKHSYVNSLLDQNFHINLGLWTHLIGFIILEYIVFILFAFYRKLSPGKTKLIDFAFVFQVAAMVCALIGNTLWSEGTLDYLYLKPLFVFDLKDIYSNCFMVLFLLFIYRNTEKIKTVKMKDVYVFAKKQFSKRSKKTV